MEPTGFEPVTSCVQSLPTTLRAIAVCYEVCRNRVADGICMAVFHVALQSAATQALPAAIRTSARRVGGGLAGAFLPARRPVNRFACRNIGLPGVGSVGGGAEMARSAEPTYALIALATCARLRTSGRRLRVPYALEPDRRGLTGGDDRDRLAARDRVFEGPRANVAVATTRSARPDTTLRTGPMSVVSGSSRQSMRGSRTRDVVRALLAGVSSAGFNGTASGSAAARPLIRGESIAVPSSR